MDLRLLNWIKQSLIDGSHSEILKDLEASQSRSTSAQALSIAPTLKLSTSPAMGFTSIRRQNWEWQGLRISLSCFSMSGEIPAAIGNLTALVTLIRGNILDSLRYLNQLKYLLFEHIDVLEIDLFISLDIGEDDEIQFSIFVLLLIGGYKAKPHQLLSIKHLKTSQSPSTSASRSLYLCLIMHLMEKSSMQADYLISVGDTTWQMAEQLFKDESILAVYDMLDNFCEFTSTFSYHTLNKDCPNDINEAVSSLIFAFPRCADLPELPAIHKLLGALWLEVNNNRC
ncbi:hypothetical protein COLO4_08215 [Corchorus olitorius]|uniref:Uncharacterized protein n=1 Tax=Corchorus olitorius TaxID=93759 RepID=A0A1R3KGV2_9ROSI|nr:hypothetical protein COLO4_08215 [Corchorus olitorius]